MASAINRIIKRQCPPQPLVLQSRRGFFFANANCLNISSRPSEARQDKNFSANFVSANDTAASPARLSTTSKGIFTLFMFSKVRKTPTQNTRSSANIHNVKPRLSLAFLQSRNMRPQVNHE